MPAHEPGRCPQARIIVLALSKKDEGNDEAGDEQPAAVKTRDIVGGPEQGMNRVEAGELQQGDEQKPGGRDNGRVDEQCLRRRSDIGTEECRAESGDDGEVAQPHETGDDAAWDELRFVFGGASRFGVGQTGQRGVIDEDSRLDFFIAHGGSCFELVQVRSLAALQQQRGPKPLPSGVVEDHP